MQQNDLFQNILALERQANSLTEDARRQRENQDASIEQEIQALRLKYQKDAEDYLYHFELSQRQRFDQKLQEQDGHKEKKLQQVESIYAARKEDWVEEIFQRVVGKAGD